MPETFSSDTESVHTQDEALRGIEFRTEVATKTGIAIINLLHDHHGEQRDGAEIIPATE